MSSTAIIVYLIIPIISILGIVILLVLLEKKYDKRINDNSIRLRIKEWSNSVTDTANQSHYHSSCPFCKRANAYDRYELHMIPSQYRDDTTNKESYIVHRKNNPIIYEEVINLEKITDNKEHVKGKVILTEYSSKCQFCGKEIALRKDTLIIWEDQISTNYKKEPSIISNTINIDRRKDVYYLNRYPLNRTNPFSYNNL